ncbi:MAG: hypothetical protein JWR00_2158, partial [Rubritepida sp.]|nr:hypothetical protein [Rubritepida sp.]
MARLINQVRLRYAAAMTNKALPAELFWTVPQDIMITRLGSGRLGLASAEAERRLGEAGPNTVADRPRMEIAAKIGR